MFDRRYALAALVAATILAGVVLSPFTSEPQESVGLEQTALGTGPIPQAIDTGAAGPIGGLVATSEAYQRAQSTIDGLKLAVPADPPALTSAQLSAISALTSGAVAGALTAPTTLTSTADRTALAAFARGYMEGALAGIPRSPSAARADLDEALAQAAFSALASVLVSVEPSSPASAYRSYAATLAERTFDELDHDAQMLAAGTGSGALADITLFGTALARAQLASLPADASEAQLDALASFGAGALTGLVAGVLAQDPQAGLPPAVDPYVRSWFEALGEGHVGTPPWDDPSNLALHAWADGIAASAIVGIDGTIGSIPGAVDEIEAAAHGLAAAGFVALDGLANATAPAVIADVQAYATALTTPALQYIGEPHPDVDPDATRSWLEGLGSGVEDVPGMGGDGADLLETYFGGLTSALTDLPPEMFPGNTGVLVAFGRGLTDNVTERLGSLAATAVSEDDPALLEAMATGLAQSAVALAGGPALDPALVERLGMGYAGGFLASSDPQTLFNASDELRAITGSWFATGPPADATALYFLAQDLARGRYDALWAYANASGAAPRAWAADKGRGFVDEAEALVWLASYQRAQAEVALGILMTDHGIDERNLTAATAAIADVYLPAALRAIGSWDPTNVTGALNGSAIERHAVATANHLMAPVGWLGGPSSVAETMAAVEVANHTLTHAGQIDRLANASYATAVLGYLDAIGKGLEAGGDDPTKNATNASHAPSWVAGVLDALVDLPANATQDDMADRRRWLESAVTSASVARIEGITDAQETATRRFAYDIGMWTLSARGRAPDAGSLEWPLLVWTDASIRAALLALPPVLTEEEMDAASAYVEGIARAANDLPPFEPAFWELQDAAGLEAYIGGIASGIPLVANDTNDFLCASSKTRSLAHDCPEPGGEDPEPCLIGCPEPEPDPEPKPEPGCDAACAIDAWNAQLLRWSENLSVEGIGAIPNTTPTQAGVLLVQLWAQTSLAGEGICPDFEHATYECDGPRGPALAFADARAANVRTYARALGAGYAALVDAEDPPAHLEASLGPLATPIRSWADGLANSAMNALIQGDPGDDGDREGAHAAGAEPTLPLGPPTPEGDDAAEDILRWTDSVWSVVEQWEGYYVPLPETPVVDDAVVGLWNLFAQEIWVGGYAALNETGGNASAFGRGLVPSGALDAWAKGLGAAILQDANATAASDVPALLAWYRALAEGGVGALDGALRQVNDSQAPALAAYAQTLASSFTPPAPPVDVVLETIFPPPEPEGNESGSGGTGGSGGNETPPAPPSPRDVYLAALQAHAEGLAAAALLVPDPSQTTWGAYAHALASAAGDLPGVNSKDFAAILSTWTQREAEGALAAQPPTTSDRLAPDVDATRAFGAAYVKAFGASSPWNLPADVDRQAVWARSAIVAGAGVLCPAELDAAACGALGATLGDALGRSLPREVAGRPVPTAQDQVDALRALLEGVAPSVGTTDPAMGVAIVAGLVQGLLPEHASIPAEVGTISALVSEALVDQAQGLSPSLVEAIAAEIADAVPTAQEIGEMQLKRRINDAVVRGVYTAQHVANEPTAVRAAVKSYLAGDPIADPVVRVMDGTRTLGIGELDGTRALDGLVPLRFTLSPTGGNTPLHENWRMYWRLGDAPEQEKQMVQAPDGTWLATLQPEAIADGERAAKLSFHFYQVVGTASTEARREGKDFSFVPDRDLPTVTLTAPDTASGATIPLSWQGVDGDSRVASYRVETKDDAGAWTTWIASTLDTDATFSGVAGHTYSFRVLATDAAGHASAASAETHVLVPAGAPPNRAPTLSILAPAPGAVLGASIPVEIAASDPDGTTPFVRVCLRKAESAVDLACPEEGKAATLSLDARGLADGRYRVHAIATDGTLSVEALSEPFGIDRAPPAFRGAAVDATPTSALLTAAVDGDAARVVAEVGGRTLALADDGNGADLRAGDGTWTARLALQPGEHAVVFRASDANGNEGSIERTVVVPAPPPPPGDDAGETPQPPLPAPTPPGAAPAGTPPDEPVDGIPAATNGTPMPPLAWALVALAGVALALRRRGHA